MPKEVIQFCRSEQPTATSIEVLWDKNHCHVQLHVQRHQFAAPVKPRECRNGCDGITSGCAECGPAGTNMTAEPEAEIFTDPLSRNEINRIITVLRRARDQAFGADA